MCDAAPAIWDVPGWLEQKWLSNGALLVRDYPGELFRIACHHCARAGRVRLAERFGPAAWLPDVLDHLADDWPQRGWGGSAPPAAPTSPALLAKG